MGGPVVCRAAQGYPQATPLVEVNKRVDLRCDVEYFQQEGGILAHPPARSVLPEKYVQRSVGKSIGVPPTPMRRWGQR